MNLTRSNPIEISNTHIQNPTEHLIPHTYKNHKHKENKKDFITLYAHDVFEN